MTINGHIAFQEFFTENLIKISIHEIKFMNS